MNKTVSDFIKSDYSNNLKDSDLIGFELKEDGVLYSKWKFKPNIIEKLNIPETDCVYEEDHDMGLFMEYFR